MKYARCLAVKGAEAGPLSLDTDGGSRNVRGFESVAQARSSVEEHYLDTVGVGGSIPPVPTTSAQAVFAAKHSA